MLYVRAWVACCTSIQGAGLGAGRRRGLQALAKIDRPRTQSAKGNGMATCLVSRWNGLWGEACTWCHEGRCSRLAALRSQRTAVNTAARSHQGTCVRGMPSHPALYPRAPALPLWPAGIGSAGFGIPPHVLFVQSERARPHGEHALKLRPPAHRCAAPPAGLGAAAIPLKCDKWDC